jgi:molybdopterin converting factor subunit 1
VKVRIRLFAMLRQQAGWQQREIRLADGATIEDAWRALAQAHPALAASRDFVRFARNGHYSAPTEQLADGDELALIPPVAGGAADASLRRLELRAEPLGDGLLAELRAGLPTAHDGAVVFFVGQTRETAGTPAPGQEAAAARHADDKVEWLDYEAFEELALDTFAAIAAEIEQRFGVRRLAIIHRTGRVAVGEPSVIIGAAAAHRGDAFDACRYAIEELKARAPIWKSEHYADGSVWIGAPAREAPLSDRAQEDESE